MFDRFTDSARRVFVRAQDEAKRMRHNYLGAEHLLLGILQVEECLAAESLQARGVTLAVARTQLAEMIGEGQAESPTHVPLDISAKRSIHEAARLANRMNQPYIRTEHLLLGLLNQGEHSDNDVAVRALIMLGVTPERIREDLLLGLAGLLRTVEDVLASARENIMRSTASVHPVVADKETPASTMLAPVAIFLGYRPGTEDVDTLSVIAAQGCVVTDVKIQVREPDGQMVWVEPCAE